MIWTEKRNKFTIIFTKSKRITGSYRTFVDWKCLNVEGDALKVGGCGSWKDDVGDDGGKLLFLLLLELKNVGLFFNVSSPLCISMSTMLGVFFNKVLATSFFPRSSFLNSNPIRAIRALNDFACKKIFLSTGSNFCQKLALLSLPCVKYKLMSSCIPFPKLRVARRYFWTSSVGILVYMYQ